MAKPGRRHQWEKQLIDEVAAEEGRERQKGWPAISWSCFPFPFFATTSVLQSSLTFLGWGVPWVTSGDTDDQLQDGLCLRPTEDTVEVSLRPLPQRRKKRVREAQVKETARNGGEGGHQNRYTLECAYRQVEHSRTQPVSKPGTGPYLGLALHRAPLFILRKEGKKGCWPPPSSAHFFRFWE